MSRPAAILFELHHLGDAVLSLPFVRAALTKYDLQVVCRRASADVFRQLLPAEKMHCWEPFWETAEKWQSLAQLPALLEKLRTFQPELAVSVWADSRVHLLMRLTGAKRTVGFPVNRQNFYAHERSWRRRRMIFGQALGVFARLDQPLQREDYQQAHWQDWRQLTLAAGLPWNVVTPWFPVPARRENGPLLVLHPGGRLPTKRWPVERFEALLRDDLFDQHVWIIAPPDSSTPRLVSPLHRLVQTETLQDLIDVLNEANAVLCNDSLVSHLAAALGKRVFSIFGSGNPNWFAPFGSENRVIATDVCPFRPCVDRCLQPSIICLESVSSNLVAAALKNG